jgi:pSer/pThr/pTyr-binding forkhead associated (FHA) protein
VIAVGKEATMFDRVILTATDGGLKGQTFVLENGTSSTLGRSRDCSVRLPREYDMVSRHHCLIDVGASRVRVWDLGSLNGTYVNGEKIGQRAWDEPAEEALRHEHPECSLCDGDELQLGNAVFRVDFFPPTPCAAEEPRDQEQLWTSEAVAYC